MGPRDDGGAGARARLGLHPPRPEPAEGSHPLTLETFTGELPQWAEDIVSSETTVHWTGHFDLDQSFFGYQDYGDTGPAVTLEIPIAGGEVVTAHLIHAQREPGGGSTWTGIVPEDATSTVAFSEYGGWFTGVVDTAEYHVVFRGFDTELVALAITPSDADCDGHGPGEYEPPEPEPEPDPRDAHTADTGSTAGDTAVDSDVTDTDGVDDCDPHEDCTPRVYDQESGVYEQIDVMVVYGQDAVNYFGSVSLVKAEAQLMVALFNVAMRGSQVTARAQLVVTISATEIQGTDWDPSHLPHGTIVGQLQDPSDGNLDDVHTVRDDLDADVVVFITRAATGASGAARSTTRPEVTDDHRAFASVGARHVSGDFKFTGTHELGHIIGGCHERTQGECEVGITTKSVDKEFAHQIVPGRKTVMWSGYGQRANRFSNVNETLYGAPAGTTSPITVWYGGSPYSLIANAVAQFNWSDSNTYDVAAFRGGRDSTGQASVITSPIPDAGIQTNQTTFYWNDSDAFSYALDIYDDFGGTLLASSGIVTTTSATINLGSSGDAFVAQLWTETLPGVWYASNTRYNAVEEWRDCSTEGPDSLPIQSLSSLECHSVCSRTASGEYTCSLDTNAVASGQPYLNVSDAPGHFDIAAWGRTDSGTDFCCLMDARPTGFEDFTLKGSDGADQISLSAVDALTPPPCPTPPSCPAYTVTINGLASGDLLVGSPFLDELILGQGGDDDMWGNGGNDELRAGEGEDDLHGGDDEDILISPTTDGDVDTLWGDAEDSVFCLREDDDVVVAYGGTGTTQRIYHSSASSNPPNAGNTAPGATVNCGHPTWTGSWPSGLCTVETMAQPAECVGHVP